LIVSTENPPFAYPQIISAPTMPTGAEETLKVEGSGGPLPPSGKNIALNYEILGPLSVRDGNAARNVAGRKPRALLALLLLHPNELVPAERLIDDLWSANPPRTAPNTLQVYVAQLRKVLGADRLLTERDGYRLRVAPDELDAARFETLAREGRTALEDGAHDEAAAQLREALGLWQGPVLADVRYESFAQAEIARLEELRLQAIEDRIEAELALGRHEDLIAELEALVAQQPLRERLRAELMLALYRGGRQADALAAYRATRQALVEELGLEPSRELQELEQAILRQDPSLSLHRLPAGNLPAPASTLIGREQDIAFVADLLRREDGRLVTLTGPGGAGKTRLAVEVATVLAGDFPDGVFFVGLETIHDTGLVLPTIAQALGVRESGDQPLASAIQQRLSGKQLLLVLDNLEQVLAAGPLLANLLAAVRGLKLLVTSRAALNVRAEQEFPVPPLTGDAAVDLFVARAQAADPSFALTDENSGAVAQICAHLDRLPLALELAAARIRVLTPEAMLKRLDRRLELLTSGPGDLPERQRALRATIDWSYQLLDRDERRLFVQLAVFAGGCSLEAAETVCRAELDTLSSLVAKSLVHREALPGGEARFAMLETIREYALERLGRGREAEALRRRHAEHVLQFSDAEPIPDQAAWLRRLDLELDNVRVALAWALESGKTELALRLAASLWEFWWIRGRLTEGRRWLDWALAQEDEQPKPHRARALHAAASLATRQGDFEGAAKLSERSLRLWEELGDLSGKARALLSLGTVAAEQGDRERARSLSEQAASLYGEAGDRRGRALAVSNLGAIALEEADFSNAKTLSAEAYDLFEELSDGEGMAFALVNQGYAALAEGSYDRALEFLRESMRGLAELGFQDVIGYCFEGLAAVYTFQGRVKAAARLLGAADALRERLGVDLAPAERETHEETVTAVRSQLGGSFVAEWEEGRSMSVDRAVAYALLEPVGESRRATARTQSR
jgi:predicted ATPase/DNA-binding SARP family transcriptional activator